MEDLFLNLKSEENHDFITALDTFLNNYATVKKFEFLNKENFRSQIWEIIFLRLKNEEYQSFHEKCLAALRILSRDKTDLDNILSKDKLSIILKYADLNVIKKQYNLNSVTNEAQKLLCNLLFNSSKIQRIITETKCLKCVMDRIRKYDEGTQHEIKLFDVRIIFLITALNISTRNVVSNELSGNIQLVNMLYNISQNLSENNVLKDDDATIVCEILKTLFNLFIQPKDSKVESVEELETNEKLIVVLRKLFLSDNETHKENLENNIVNLLTVLPISCYSKLITPVNDKIAEDAIIYQDKDMIVINLLLKFLENRLECKKNIIENLSPILTCLIRICKTDRLIRKYIRMQILPPLQDVTKRPEEGLTLRNKLCKLLTNPITEIRDLDAEFLFILCKENVGRMIKYTGYGNAAGMLANKGLLGPDNAKIDYSSDSEDSETEEYKKYKDSVNPVTGCYEKENTSPFEGMTEEQKEHEALKLVGLINQLQREGVIQPCRIGEDGKPKPIDHVLELGEHLPKQQINKRGSDSD